MTDPTPASPLPPASLCPSCGAPIASDAPSVDGSRVCPGCLLGAGSPTGGTAADVPSAAAVAARFPDYEILGLLGRGGMGVVWKARHRGLDRVVALKVLPTAVAGQPGFAERFQREARALARLTHPNIVGVHEFGDRDGTYFLVMEYVDGVNMRHAMREGVIGPRDALRMVPQICDALQYAHDHGVVHRDIKPENVLIARDGRLKVADFGLAKIASAPGDTSDAAARGLTVTGNVMGTPHYMAPEQVERPGAVDHRADIYSLGVVFYEMLTGELPLGRFDAPSKRVQVDVRFDEVVLRSLEKSPDRRWQHAADVKTEVGTIAAGPVAATAAPQHTARLCRLAVWGLALVLAGPATGIAVAAAARAAGTGVGIPEMALLASGLTLAGWAASVVAWVRIGRSRGALRGRGFAIAGALLPLAAPCLAVPVMLFLPARAQSAAAASGWDVRAVGTPDAGPEAARNVPESLTSPVDTRQQMQDLWVALQGVHPHVSPSDVHRWYVRESWPRVVADWDREGAEAAARGERGLPFMSEAAIGEPLAAFHGWSITVDDAARTATLTATSDTRRLVVHLRFAESVWRFTDEPVTVRRK